MMFLGGMGQCYSIRMKRCVPWINIRCHLQAGVSKHMHVVLVFAIAFHDVVDAFAYVQ